MDPVTIAEHQSASEMLRSDWTEFPKGAKPQMEGFSMVHVMKAQITFACWYRYLLEFSACPGSISQNEEQNKPNFGAFGATRGQSCMC